MKAVAVASLLLACSVAFAFRPAVGDTAIFWLAGSAPLALVAAFAGYELHERNRLGPLLRPKAGDITLGFALGAILLLLSWGGRSLLAEQGTDRFAWLLHVYLSFGDPNALQHSILMTALLLGIVIAEEIVFRGWMQERLTERLDARRGWWVTALIQVAIAAPTSWTLRAPGVGPNPLLVLATLVTAAAFGFTRHLSGRLPPIIIAHGFFTYYSVVQFRLPGL